MCISLCVCMHACLYVCMYAYVYVRARACVCIYMSLRMYVCMHVYSATVLQINISERPCEALTPPKHGTLACDSNMGGSFCSMSCDEDWDIPRSARAVDTYSCGWSTGTWLPTSDVPDCTGNAITIHLFINPAGSVVTQRCKYHTAVKSDTRQRFTWERDVAPWQERSLMVRCVVRSILHGVELFLVPPSAPRLV